MRRKLLPLMLSFTVLGSVAVPTVFAAGATAAPVKVKLLGINDFHGQLDTVADVKDSSGKVVDQRGGASYLATYLKELQKSNPNNLLVHAGDVVGASDL